MIASPLVRAQISSPLQASKWLTIPVLLDVAEMQALLLHLESFGIFLVNGPVAAGGGQVTQSDFLRCYEVYIQALKRGQVPQMDAHCRACFSSVWTVSSEALYLLNLENQQQLVKTEKPVIQLQAHRFDYSPLDGKFRSMIFGSTSLTWGIQFSYPQLYQDAKMHVHSVLKSDQFVNTPFFKKLQKWIRDHTVATPFFIEQKRINVPIRLGKQCFAWINQHPQFAAKGLQVVT
jgi:hypothetical protein